MNSLAKILCLFLLAQAPASAAKNRFSQIILPFPNKRTYAFKHNAEENLATVEITNTQASELEALNYYDDQVVKRVLINQDGSTAKIKLYLKDKDIKLTITDFADPFRIVIDLFDEGYQEQLDPVTNLPVFGTGVADKAEEPANELGYDESMAADGTQRRKLLQPPLQDFEDQSEVVAGLEKVESGPGKSWSEYPIYVYRIQTKIYDKYGNDPQDHDSKTVKKVSPDEALAAHAGSLYDFGHERKALVAYQKLLLKAPFVFDQNPLHIWRLAEVHLGQGNLTLADGYYQSLMDKHPESELSSYAQMRRLDIKAIKATQNANTAEFASIVKGISLIRNNRENPELEGQKNIRMAYWSAKDEDQKALLKDHNHLPDVRPEILNALVGAPEQLENKWTEFLGASLVLSEMLDTKKWSDDTANYAGKYFERFKGEKSKEIKSRLLSRTGSTFTETINGLVQNKNYAEATALIEGLPTSLAFLKGDSKIAWSTGEAYRALGQPKEAQSFYKNAVATNEQQMAKFRAAFWYAVTMDEANSMANLTGGKSKNKGGKKSIAAADAELAALWSELKESEQEKLYSELKTDIENTVQLKYRLKTPAKILLDRWSKSAEMATGGTVAGSPQPQDSNSMTLLVTLAKRFSDLGMEDERTKSIELMAKMKPSAMNGNKELKTMWIANLKELAEEKRSKNDLAGAGRTYGILGQEDSENRAEYLYKSGLLLYKAGRRDEALTAFQQASQDANNLLYADLAKKRLDQLQK
ncbi:MAG: tol-pal system YbgF family protein [Oligoflexales bacterium]